MRRLLLASALLIVALPAFREAQARDDGGQESPALQAAAVNAVLARHHRSDAPGCAIGVYRGGETLHVGAFGMANLEFQVPITSRTVFDIGSTAKQFTAASVVLLAQQGRLSLDDDVRRYLPELPDYGTPMTIRQLLNHTAGLRDYNGLLNMAGFRRDDVSTTEEAYALITRQRGTNFEPGTRHLYSNTGHFLASIIVQRVAGQTLGVFARERLFEPLGMTSTLFRDDHTLLVPNRAVGYSPRGNAGYQIDVSNWEQVGDGGLFTNVEDLSRWAGNLGSGSVGGQGLVDALHTRGMLRDGSAIDYTIGLRHGSVGGRAFIEHDGGWGGYVSHFRRFPVEGLTVAALCNDSQAPVLALVESITDIYLGSGAGEADGPRMVSEQPIIRLSEAQLEVWAGEYRDRESGETITIVREGEALFARGSGPRFTLRPVSPSRFRVIDGPADAYAQFETGTEGPRSVAFFLGDRLLQTFQVVSRVSVSPADLASHVGNYRCSEIDAVFGVEVDDGALVVSRPRAPSARFLPLERNVFQMGRVAITFSGANNANSRAFRIDTPRVRGLQCDRIE
jgi:CubicO group peptidase (beta-lactamase class C family)